MNRINISTQTLWEPLVGYSRAVRVGPNIYVSGTTATDSEGTIVGIGDLYAQTVQALKNLREAIEHAGGRIEDVVRTRIFVTDISRWEEVAKSHGEVFGEIRPVTTMVQISRLISEEMLIEIEADAFVSN